MNRTITDIIPPSRRRSLEEGGAATPPPPPPPRPVLDGPPPPERPARIVVQRRFPYGTALIALIVVAGSVAAMYNFAGAKVTVTPTSNPVNVTGDFTATSGGGDLPFEVVTVDKTASSEVPAESTETVNDPAQGTITIYNSQPTPQTLIKNTRFQTPDGLIFRIRDSVSVPPGSATAPGHVDSPVYADAGGDSYNIQPTTFTVPGLKGSKAFDLVTAKSSAAMTGGFSGTRASVSQATRDAQVQKNHSALESSLKDAITAQIPAGYVLIPGASFTTYTTMPDAPGKGSNSVAVAEKGTVTAVVFPSVALGKAIAYKALGTYSGQPIHIGDTSGLTLTPATPGAPVGPTYAFSLSGSTNLVWDIDPTRIAGAVAGKSRDAAQNVLSSFSEVDTAVLVLRPFWKTSFPDDPSKITVSTSTPASK